MSMLSAILLALHPGLEGKSPAPSGAAGNLSRAVQFLSPYHQRDQRRSQSWSLLEDAMVAIFEKGNLPIPGRSFLPHFQTS